MNAAALPHLNKPERLPAAGASSPAAVPDRYRPMRFFVRREDGTASGPHSAARTRSILGSWDNLVCAEGSDEWVSGRLYADEISGAAKERDISRRTRAWWFLARFFPAAGLVCVCCFFWLGWMLGVLGGLVCSVALFIKRAPRRGFLALLFSALLWAAPFLIIGMMR